MRGQEMYRGWKRIFYRKDGEQRLLGRPRLKWENNIKMSLKEIELQNV
jgi:hypothetical protein